MLEGEPRVGVLLGLSENSSPNLRGLGEMLPHFGMELLPPSTMVINPNCIPHVDFLISALPIKDFVEGVMLGIAIDRKVPVMLLAEEDTYPRSSLFGGREVIGVDYFANRDLQKVAKQFGCWLEDIERERMAAAIPTERFFVNGGLSIDYALHEVSVDGQVTHVTPTEFRLIDCLGRRLGRVVEKDEILVTVWGAEYRGEEHLLRVYMTKTRGKLGETAEDPRFVVSHRGVGYRMLPEASN